MVAKENAATAVVMQVKNLVAGAVETAAVADTVEAEAEEKTVLALDLNHHLEAVLQTNQLTTVKARQEKRNTKQKISFRNFLKPYLKTIKSPRIAVRAFLF